MITRDEAVAALAHFRAANIASRFTGGRLTPPPAQAQALFDALPFLAGVEMYQEIDARASAILRDFVTSHERAAERLGGVGR